MENHLRAICSSMVPFVASYDQNSLLYTRLNIGTKMSLSSEIVLPNDFDRLKGFYGHQNLSEASSTPKIHGSSVFYLFVTPSGSKVMAKS